MGNSEHWGDRVSKTHHSTSKEKREERDKMKPASVDLWFSNAGKPVNSSTEASHIVVSVQFKPNDFVGGTWTPEDGLVLSGFSGYSPEDIVGTENAKAVSQQCQEKWESSK